MRVPLPAAALLVSLAVLPVLPAAASPLYGGPYAGTVAAGETDTHAYSTHPPQAICLAVYIPHLFVVTLSAAPTDTMQVSVGSLSATTQNGVATLQFVANYCTSFDIAVTGLATTAGAYAVTVSHVNAINGGVLDPAVIA